MAKVFWSETREMLFEVEVVGHRARLQVFDGHEWWRYSGLLGA